MDASGGGGLGTLDIAMLLLPLLPLVLLVLLVLVVLLLEDVVVLPEVLLLALLPIPLLPLPPPLDPLGLADVPRCVWVHSLSTEALPIDNRPLLIQFETGSTLEYTARDMTSDKFDFELKPIK